MPEIHSDISGETDAFSQDRYQRIVTKGSREQDRHELERGNADSKTFEDRSDLVVDRALYDLRARAI